MAQKNPRAYCNKSRMDFSERDDGEETNSMDDHLTLKKKAAWLRHKVFEMAVRAHSGHISTAFSQAELLVALYHGGILKYDAKNPRWDGRDRFILSKGQGGLGLYPVLADVGFFPLAELDIFAQRDSILGVHTDWHIPGVEVITGSLGHGLPIATGKAQAALNDGKKHLIFCLLGDAELDEGSNWEAALFAGHMGYDNLVCIVDRNGQGTIGKTDVVDAQNDGPRLGSVEDKFRSFGFEARSIDGHDFGQIFKSLEDIRRRRAGKPLVVVANTKKGRGLTLMEDKRLWHYRVPEGEDVERCRRELRAELDRLGVAEAGVPAPVASGKTSGY
jgi:transketolase